MKEVLRNYKIWTDLVRLNNDDYFHRTFATPDVD